MTEEGQVLKDCLDFLSHVPCSRFFRRNIVSGSRHGHYVQSGPKYHADIWGIFEGRHVEIEIKKPGWIPGKGNAKQTERERKQAEWRQEVIDLGGIALWADSLDMLIQKWETETHGLRT